MVRFTKMNGAGNDFVLFDNRDRQLTLEHDQIARLCDRHRGVGADGVLVVEPSDTDADFRMRYYNSDGGEAEMCGNGARCFARFARRLQGGKSLSFDTPAGRIHAWIEGEHVRIGMSDPSGLRLNEELEVENQRLTVHSVNTGVPHAVVFVDQLDLTPVHDLGAALRFHPHFAPRGTNVNFVSRTGRGALAIRTYERGVEGETLACGTGVVASAIILHALHGDPAPIEVTVQGGDTLRVSFETSGEYQRVMLAGPADFVFDGEIAI